MRRLIRSVFILGTIPTVGIYILASLSAHISPVSFWPMTFLGLGFPYIAIVYLVISAIWLLIRKSASVLLLLLFIVFGYKNLSSTLALNYSKFRPAKDSSSIRILSWNVRYFDNCAKSAESPDSVRRKMINFLKEANADVLLLQEFKEYLNESFYSNIKVLRDTLGFKHYYFTKDKVQDFSSEDGVIIFSKLPITDSGKVTYDTFNVEESIGYADVQFKNRNLRLATTHLLSMSLFKPEQVAKEGKFINYDQAYFVGKSRYRPLRLFDSIHSEQAVFVRNFLNKSPHPVIMTGDFNSVPTSYVYHKIRGNLNDAFIEKGKWLGTSYQGLSPTLRIDYILTDPSIRVRQFTTPKIILSDHFPLITDVSWKN